ncbi:MAG: peptide chain release factor N(5)-glutamine methyltransferase [Terracidiphilus sp.]
MSSAPKSRSAVIDAAARLLAEGPYPDHARRDAEELLLHLLRKDARERNRAWLFANLRSVISDQLETDFLSLAARRAAGEPIQYITGEADFCRMPFRVTPDVLIPRPETELLVEKVTDLVPIFMPRSRKPLGFRLRVGTLHIGEDEELPWPRIVDVGTGSGAIAVSIAHNWSETKITAIDLSTAALDLARSNAKRLGFADQIRFLQGDLLTPVAEEKFEIIVSNPPYVPESDRPTLSVEVRDHEPALALFAGPDGLDIYRRLIPQAFACLVRGGYLALEIGYGQSAAIETLMTSSGFQQIEFIPDLQQIPRVALAQHP